MCIDIAVRWSILSPMSIAENEALASLRILVAIARADGTVHNDERKSLAAALESLELPGGMTVEKLLSEQVDVAGQLRELKSPESREQTYRSAYFMAYADGTCTKEEQALLDQIAEATEPTDETRMALDRMFVGRASGGEPSRVTAIVDPVARAAETAKLVLRYSILTAALGAFPIPGLSIATDLGVIALQLKMIRDVGGFWGHSIDTHAAKSLLYGVGLGTGARLAIATLAKLLPGWGSVGGATTSVVSTYALGKVIEKFFADGGGNTKPSPETLRSDFKAAEEAARAVYANQQDVIIQSQRFTKDTLEALSKDLKAGKITQDEFDAQVSQIPI
jgi:uncharacterized protein (DUF697 family)/tellurite resistance protein